MAIFGTIKSLIEQCDNQLFINALHYLQSTNLSKIFEEVKEGAPIEIEIEGRSVYAIFQTYETKPIEKALLEGHKKHIDIQYIHSGTEQILVSPSSRMIKDAEYDENKDLYFPKAADFSNIRLSAGMGCILYPDDLHAPCISLDAPSKIEKIVIKVAVKE